MKNAYSEVIDEYVQKMIENFSDELELLFVIGSSASTKVVEYWSDIDIILVIKDYNFAILERIKKLTNNFPVKIGTTIYSKKEFIDKRIDPKTYYHLYMLDKKMIKLQYKKDNLTIPKVTFEDIKATHIPYLNWRIHTYKRNFLYDSLSKDQIKGLFKTTYLIMKARLILKGLAPKNYEDVFKLYSKEFNFEYYDYEKFINNYQNDNREYENIVDYAKKIILSITN